MYLRKSRADFEAEARGEGETLAKHRNTLLKVAKERNLNIIKIREELVSGESIIHRPQMVELLREVENKKFDAVLCMDIDRLGRGKMQEQGIILEAFKESNTRIITPRKIYNLNDEWDEEYSEFEAFMARKELKIITRRLQSGRLRSVEDGNYLGTRPPYGYTIVKTGKDRYLEPEPEQAKVVKMIFELYTNESPENRLGASKIANYLNQLGLKSYTGKHWTNSSILSILKNAVYIGRIQWKKKETKKSKEPGKRRDVGTRPQEEWVDIEGKHDPLISVEVYQTAQDILLTRYHVPYKQANGITNPLAGLIKCGFCNSSMVYRPYSHQRYPHLMCYNRTCSNKSSRFEYVEKKLLDALWLWLENYQIVLKTENKPQQDNTTSVEIKEKAFKSLQRDLEDLYTQKNRLHDLLEQNIYDVNTYVERSKTLALRIEDTNKALATLKEELVHDQLNPEAFNDAIPKVKHILELYHKSESPSNKNQLLKSVLKYGVYKKEKSQRDDDFSLVIYPKLDLGNSGLRKT